MSALQAEKPECTVKFKGVAQSRSQDFGVVSWLWEPPPGPPASAAVLGSLGCGLRADALQ